MRDPMEELLAGVGEEWSNRGPKPILVEAAEQLAPRILSAVAAALREARGRLKPAKLPAAGRRGRVLAVAAAWRSVRLACGELTGVAAATATSNVRVTGWRPPAKARLLLGGSGYEEAARLAVEVAVEAEEELARRSTEPNLLLLAPAPPPSHLAELRTRVVAVLAPETRELASQLPDQAIASLLLKPGEYAEIARMPTPRGEAKLIYYKPRGAPLYAPAAGVILLGGGAEELAQIAEATNPYTAAPTTLELAATRAEAELDSLEAARRRTVNILSKHLGPAAATLLAKPGISQAGANPWTASRG